MSNLLKLICRFNAFPIKFIGINLTNNFFTITTVIKTKKQQQTNNISQSVVIAVVF